MGDVYPSHDHGGGVAIAGDVVPATANPMHVAALEHRVSQKDKELEASKATIEELRRENEQLRQQPPSQAEENL